MPPSGAPVRVGTCGTPCPGEVPGSRGQGVQPGRVRPGSVQRLEGSLRPQQGMARVGQEVFIVGKTGDDSAACVQPDDG